jgi:hypothetical protein
MPSQLTISRGDAQTENVLRVLKRPVPEFRIAVIDVFAGDGIEDRKIHRNGPVGDASGHDPASVTRRVPRRK